MHEIARQGERDRLAVDQPGDDRVVEILAAFADAHGAAFPVEVRVAGALLERAFLLVVVTDRFRPTVLPVEARGFDDVDAGELGEARRALRFAAQGPAAVAVVGEVEGGATDLAAVAQRRVFGVERFDLRSEGRQDGAAQRARDEQVLHDRTGRW